jgi:hypothetical protein
MKSKLEEIHKSTTRRNKLLILSILLFLVLLSRPSPLQAQASCVHAPSDIMAWWPGDGNANDFSGINNGTLQGGVSFVPGEVSSAFGLDGTSGFVQVPKSSAWSFTGDFTIDLWANFTVVRSGGVGRLPNVFVGQDEGGGNQSKWVFFLADGGLSFHINSPSLGPIFLGPIQFTPTPANWYHLAVAKSGNTYQFYVNGSSVGSVSTANPVPFPQPNAPLTIGQAEGLGFFNGGLDEIQIFGRALSSSEIQAIFNAGSNGQCKNGPPLSGVCQTGSGLSCQQVCAVRTIVSSFADQNHGCAVTSSTGSCSITGGSSGPTGVCCVCSSE